MDATDALGQLGGVASHADLTGLVDRRTLARAVAAREVVRIAHGRYALPAAVAGITAAQYVGGTVALRSAAAHHGWPQKTQPPIPEIAVPRNTRNSDARRRAGVRLLWTDLAETEVVDGVTTPVRTVVDCARRLPFDEALAIADSALRLGSVTMRDLGAVTVSGPGSARVRAVLAAVDSRAANPFESVLRALCIDVGLSVVPQEPLPLNGVVFHPDLTCAELGLLIEADSFTFHSGRQAFKLDCDRYNRYTLAGWRLLRFTYEQVVGGQDEVRRVLGRAARMSRT